MAQQGTDRHYKDRTASHSTGTRWGKAWRIARLVFFVLLGLMGTLILGALLMSTPNGVLSLSESMRSHFWLIAGMRWAAYGLVIGFWPGVADALTRLATKPGDSREKKDHVRGTLQGWRWPLARILTVYELMFPLNLAGWLGGLL